MLNEKINIIILRIWESMQILIISYLSENHNILSDNNYEQDILKKRLNILYKFFKYT